MLCAASTGGLFLALALIPTRVCWAQSNSSENAKPQDQQTQDASGPAKQDETQKKDDKSGGRAVTNIRISVTTSMGKPVENASVYVRFPENGGLFHHEKLQELDLKTNLDGSVKVPPVPRGKVLIQVIAKGWRTFGQWYEMDSELEKVSIKLDPPPHWY